jgi:hypothetical protein
MPDAGASRAGQDIPELEGNSSCVPPKPIPTRPQAFRRRNPP